LVRRIALARRAGGSGGTAAVAALVPSQSLEDLLLVTDRGYAFVRAVQHEAARRQSAGCACARTVSGRPGRGKALLSAAGIVVGADVPVAGQARPCAGCPCAALAASTRIETRRAMDAAAFERRRWTWRDFSGHGQCLRSPGVAGLRVRQGALEHSTRRA